MVPDHWSNDAMVSMDRRGLAWMHTSAAAIEWNCSDCTPLQLCPLEGQVLKLSHAAPYKEKIVIFHREVQSGTLREFCDFRGGPVHVLF